MSGHVNPCLTHSDRHRAYTCMYIVRSVMPRLIRYFNGKTFSSHKVHVANVSVGVYVLRICLVALMDKQNVLTCFLVVFPTVCSTLIKFQFGNEKTICYGT